MRPIMTKTVTLRLNEKIYNLFWTLAKTDNRTLSNFIETSALRYIDEHHAIDDFEMAEILNNQELNKSVKRAIKDAKLGKGRFVD
jgi:uncharacterized protein (DUF1778 family)